MMLEATFHGNRERGGPRKGWMNDVLKNEKPWIGTDHVENQVPRGCSAVNDDDDDQSLYKNK